MNVLFSLGSVYGSFNQIFLKLNILQTSENDGSRTYASLVQSTEDSDIEYVNQLPAPEYVNAC